MIGRITRRQLANLVAAAAYATAVWIAFTAHDALLGLG